MEKTILGFMLIFLIILSSCTQHKSSPTTSTNVKSAIVIENESVESASFADSSDHLESQASSGETEGNHQVFDFNELPQGEYPYPDTTLNQLFEKYGEPVSIKFVTAPGFPPLSVNFNGFSFFMFLPLENYNDFDMLSSSDVRPKLSEKQKNIDLKILCITISDKNAKFPRGITIGTEKARVLAAYPEGSEFISEYDEFDVICYDYDFLSDSSRADSEFHGYILYYFDKNGMLDEVKIQWFYHDV